MERKLASIQTIIEINPIEGADKIEVASILGWKVVVEKGKYKPGDSVVYAEIDSFLPIRPEFEFLRKSCYKKLIDDSEGFRIKTVKLRKQISQGICFPLDILKDLNYPNDNRENPTYAFAINTDVTSFLNITKYIPYIPAILSGICKGKFPSFLHKTDEIRIQAVPKIINELSGKEVYIATKVDGSSATFYYNNGEFGVCSRNLEFLRDEKNSFWKTAIELDLENKLKSIGKNIAIQGELYGNGIQSNRLQISNTDLAVFNIFDIDTYKYYGYRDFVTFVNIMGLKTVPIDKVTVFNFALEELLEMAKGKYEGTDNHREGIVIRPTQECYSDALDGRMSIKVLNNDYLIAYGEYDGN